MVKATAIAYHLLVVFGIAYTIETSSWFHIFLSKNILLLGLGVRVNQRIHFPLMPMYFLPLHACWYHANVTPTL